MTPLYQVIMKDLKEQIETGVLKPGDQLPTEKELSLKYEVSRITSKRALTELEQSGFINRIQGKGSFVKESKNLATNSKRILFLLPFTNDLALGNFSEGLLPVIQQAGFEVMITSFEFLNTHQGKDIMEEFDGLIYYTNDETEQLDLLFDLHSENFPVIVLDKAIHDISFPSVLSDNFSGGKLACDYLIKMGHQKIGYLFGTTSHPQSTRQRYLGYLQSIKEHQLSFYTTMDDPDALASQLKKFITKHQLTALICENDFTAIDAMNLLRRMGREIPEDISIIGFDDIQAASLVDPPLSTISQNFRQIGEIAGEKIISWITTGKIPSHKKVPVDLIIRKSIKERKHYD